MTEEQMAELQKAAQPLMTYLQHMHSHVQAMVNSSECIVTEDLCKVISSNESDSDSITESSLSEPQYKVKMMHNNHVERIKKLFTKEE